MKERAGLVGRTGASEALRKIRAQAPNLKVHLIGHSFGGRLVTAVALGPGGQPAQKFASMTLLQAAFSHNGFAEKFDGTHDGFFRGVVSGHRVSGPVLITCTANDVAVGLYPLASLIAGQNASGIGDANDPFGGIGRNGAQRTPEADAGTLVAVGSAYSFGGKLYNLTADAVIKGHSDICKPEVARTPCSKRWQRPDRTAAPAAERPQYWSTPRGHRRRNGIGSGQESRHWAPRGLRGWRAHVL